MKLFTTISLLLFFVQTSIVSDPIYKNLEKRKYLIGDYSEIKYLKAYRNPTKDQRVHYLREDAISDLKKMIDAYQKDTSIKKKPKIVVHSAFRSYYSQKSIWESKYNGSRKMRDSVKGKKPEQIVNLILEYSSAPGTSRHHWGTDMDINSFSNAYFKKGGEGEELYEWLKKNAHTYGFCQPYNELSERDNPGYFEERWHWSYVRVSNQLMKDWIELNHKGELDYRGKFLGSDIMDSKKEKYVTSINKECANVK